MNDLMNPNAGKERLQHLINEAEQHRFASKFARKNTENAIVAFIRALFAKVQDALNSTANNRNTQPSNQSVKNSL